MVIENLNVESLVAYAKNSRTHSEKQVEQILFSIEEFGFTNPILIDENNEIIAGHGRIMAAKQLGMTEVPCIRLSHLSEAQKKGYRIADNKLALNASWDDDLLAQEIIDLRDRLEYDISLLGFESSEMDFLYDDEVKEDDFDIDKALEEIEEPISKKGDIWKLGNHRVMCGDSTDVGTVALLMDGKLADIAFTDPPWNVNYGAVDDDNAMGYKPRTILNDFMGTEQFKEFMYKAFDCMSEFSKAGCMTYVVMSAQEWGNMMLAMVENEYHWSSTIIWNKDHAVLSRKDYHTKYEPIWYGWKEGSARLRPLIDRAQNDVWDIKRPTKSELHPTMKPIELMAKALVNSSVHGDIVLDLFGGSGSTLIAAEQVSRVCYMMELDEKYVDVIVKRWELETGKKAELIKT